MKITSSISLIIITLLYSCGSMNNEQTHTSEKRISTFEYQLDSIFIDYTIFQFIEHKYREYGYSAYEGGKVYVDTIIYSPDKLKLFSIIIIEETDTPARQPFNGQAILAYRNSLNDFWKIYPIQNYSVSWKSYEGASRVIRINYFKDLKGNKDNGKNKFNYTPIEEKFWNDLYFKMGFDIDSLYYFQTELNVDIPTLERKKDKIIPYLKIDYPNELLEQYKQLLTTNAHK